MNTAASSKPTRMTCSGLSSRMSCSCERPLRTPKNAHDTAFSVSTKRRLRGWPFRSFMRLSWIARPPALPVAVIVSARDARIPVAARHLEEGVGQRDRVHVLRQLRVDHEDDRELLRLVRAERLLLEAEALELAEIRSRLPRCVARHRLADRLGVARVDEVVDDGDELARMHLERVDLGPEPPRAAAVGVELDDDLARAVDLRVAREGPRPAVGLHQVV